MPVATVSTREVFMYTACDSQTSINQQALTPFFSVIV